MFRITHMTLLCSLTLMSQTAYAQVDNLASLFTKAKQHDALLEQFEKNSLATQQLEPLTESRLKPSINLLGSYSVQRHSESFYDLNSAKAGVSLQHKLYQPQTHTQVAQAKKQIHRADLEFQQAEQALMVRLVGAYFEVLKSYSDLQLTGAKQKADTLQYKRAKTANQAGLNNQTDLLEAQSNMDITNARQIRASSDFFNAVESLENLVGTPVSRIQGIQERMPLDMDLLQVTKDGTGKQETNLAVQIAESQLEIARDDVQLAKQENSPDITAALDYSYNHFSGFDEQQAMQYDNRHSWSAGLQLTIPLYDGGQKQSKIKQTQYETIRFQASLRQVKDGMRLAVKQTLRDIKQGKAHVEALQQVNKTTRAFLEATEVSYESGLRDLVDVLNARTKRFEAERDLAFAQYNWLMDVINLKALLNQLDQQALSEIDSLFKSKVSLVE